MSKIKSRLMDEEIRAWEEYAWQNCGMKMVQRRILKELVFLALFILFACSPQKRLERLVKKHPELVRSDSVKIRDTIRLKADKADTSFLFMHRSDTVVLDKGRLHVKYYYSHDSVFLSGKCRDSIIVREHTVTVNSVQPIIHQGVNGWWRAGAIVAIILAFLSLLSQFRKK